MAYRILLVDDETDILEFVRYNLSKEEYEVYTATDGAEAVRTAAECRPHLILLDMMMPVMDGIQTCRALRALPATSGAIIVFLSALGEDESQLSGFDAGADDYITKPIKMTLLKSRVNARCARRRLRAGERHRDQPRTPHGNDRRHGNRIAQKGVRAVRPALLATGQALHPRGDILPRLGQQRSRRRPDHRRAHTPPALQNRRQTHSHGQGFGLQIPKIGRKPAGIGKILLSLYCICADAMHATHRRVIIKQIHKNRDYGNIGSELRQFVDQVSGHRHRRRPLIASGQGTGRAHRVARGHSHAQAHRKDAL